jgi:hypothetical protein
MYVKIVDNAVSVWPYSIGKLKADNPSVSFPKIITDELLASYGVYEVSNDDPPDHNERTQKVQLNSQPSGSGSSWSVGWTVVDKTSAEIAEYDTNITKANRDIRDGKLQAVDWWASSDLTMTAEQTAYRQALRDITSHENWPHLEEADWPVKPS